MRNDVHIKQHYYSAMRSSSFKPGSGDDAVAFARQGVSESLECTEVEVAVDELVSASVGCSIA